MVTGEVVFASAETAVSSVLQGSHAIAMLVAEMVAGRRFIKHGLCEQCTNGSQRREQQVVRMAASDCGSNVPCDALTQAIATRVGLWRGTTGTEGEVILLSTVSNSFEVT